MKLLSVSPGLAIAFLAVVEAAAVALDVNTIIMGVIGLIGAYIAMRTTALSREVKEQKVAQVETKESLKDIHLAVNSGKTTLENKIDALISQNGELTKKVATLEENKRGAELAKAIASVPPVVVTPAVAAPAAPPAPAPASAPSGSVSPAAKLDNAIDTLHVAAKEAVIATEKTEGLAGQFTKP